MAQQKEKQIFNIGQTLPDVRLDSMVNYGKPGAKLSDFKGKLVVIDFFATWCSSCRIHLPAMDSLQRKYKDKLQIIMVSSWNTKDYVQRVQKMVDPR